MLGSAPRFELRFSFRGSERTGPVPIRDGSKPAHLVDRDSIVAIKLQRFKEGDLVKGKGETRNQQGETGEGRMKRKRTVSERKRRSRFGF